MAGAADGAVAARAAECSVAGASRKTGLLPRGPDSCVGVDEGTLATGPAAWSVDFRFASPIAAAITRTRSTPAAAAHVAGERAGPANAVCWRPLLPSAPRRSDAAPMPISGPLEILTDAGHPAAPDEPRASP